MADAEHLPIEFPREEPHYAMLRPKSYYLNWCPWNGREPEVHVTGCIYLRRADLRYTAFLGKFFDCEPAVEYAKSVIPSADG